jgi:hypothetical protein
LNVLGNAREFEYQGAVTGFTNVIGPSLKPEVHPDREEAQKTFVHIHREKKRSSTSCVTRATARGAK